MNLKQDDKLNRSLSESDSMSQLSQVVGEMGAAPQQVPPHLREMAAWATEQASRFVN